MKEIKRWHLSIPTSDNPRTLGEIKQDDKGEYVLYLDRLNEVKQLQARIKELESAERTLNNLGYRNLGGSLWKPPIGKKPDFSLIDRLNKRIEDLDIERKKTFKAGSDYFNQLQEVEKHCNELAQKVKELESQSHINEIKAQGIEEAINEANHEMHEIFDNEFHVSLHVANLRIFVDRLRTKHD